VVLFLLLAALAGVCFLSSPPPGMTPTGSEPWGEGSLLHALTTALALDFRYPTPRGEAVKSLISGAAAGLLVMIVAVSRILVGRARRAQAVWVEPAAEPPADGKRHIDPLLAAQGLLLTGVALAFASVLWSPRRDLALGGAVLLLGHVLWSFGLRYGLSAAGCRAAAVLMTIVLTACAALGIVYFYERNDYLRLGYPIGNPLFFAACMIPALMLCVCGGAAAVTSGGSRPAPRLLRLVILAAAAVVMGWAVGLAQARSTYVGLALGLNLLAIMVAWHSSPRRGLACLAVLAAVDLTGYFLLLKPRLEARSQTIRTRLYAWEYAQDLFSQAPLAGQGPGAFTLLADGLAVRDVGQDPNALDDWLHHAHNEWLEVLCEGGSAGLVCVAGALALTFLAAWRVRSRLISAEQRWLLFGLLAALAALIVEECTDVALRIAGLPTIYYVLLGMIWALIAGSRPPRPELRALPAAGAAALAIAVGFVSIVASVWDFRAARAQHDQRDRFEQRQWDEAAALARTASTFRLSPDRRIEALLRESELHVRIAAVFLQDFQRVLQEPAGSPEQRQPRETSLNEYSRRIDLHLRTAVEVLDGLIQPAGPLIGAHGTLGDACMLGAAAALGSGREEAALTLRDRGRQAYATEARRQPFNPHVVWRVLELSPDLTVAETVDLMCLPLLCGEVDQRFFDLVLDLAGTPALAEALAPGVSAGLAAAQNPDTQVIPGDVARLRIAAWAASGRDDIHTARQLLQAAANLAERIGSRFPLSAAIVYRELAHTSFIDDAGNPLAAIEAAKRADALLPNSDEAAVVRGPLLEQLAMYYVAHGGESGEADAWDCYRRLPGFQGMAREQALAGAYDALCWRLTSALPPARHPAYFESSLARYAALAPASPGPELILARRDFQRQDITAGLEHLRTAAQRGATREQLLSMARAGVCPDPHPDNALLQEFLQRLASQG
jgi:O-antigen ligase